MGALHDGHAALVQRAVDECGVVVVSIFVNPTQFGPTEDLSRYPRPLDDDLKLLESLGAHIVYVPTVEQMYPAGFASLVHVEGVALTLEAESRPTHFDGVATVVCKLLNTVGECRAYFGEKDWQQLQVVRRVVQDLEIDCEVVGVATVRESDGLALSSRNVYLTPPERKLAPVLYKALLHGRELVEQGQTDPAVVELAMRKFIDASGGDVVDVDYLKALPADSLQSVDVLEGAVRLMGAIRLGDTRLIDNIGVNVAGN
jgi:pantoate--beta-alanine ligase